MTFNVVSNKTEPTGHTNDYTVSQTRTYPTTTGPLDTTVCY